MTGADIEGEARRRRTFAIISHPDAGKTTLTEKLLLYAGAVGLAGAVRDRRGARAARSDWMEIERQRGISVTSTVLQFEHRGHVLNLVDTPGHEDFSEDTYRALAAVDSALMLLDAAKGVERRTLALFEVCRKRSLPVLTFVNKYDRPGKAPLALLDEIESVLGLPATPLNWPVGEGPGFRGLVRIRDGSYTRFDSQARGALRAVEENGNLEMARGEGEVWATAEEELALLEAAHPVLSIEDFLAQRSTAVLFGSALKNFGVGALLDELVDLCPSPRPATDVTGGHQPLDAAFSGLVFKVQANMDPLHRDRVAFIRVCSGRFQRGMHLVHGPTSRRFATSQAKRLFGQERLVVDDAFPGDVVALVNASAIRVGDTVHDGRPVAFPVLPRFMPERFAVVRNEDVGRFKQFRRALRQLDDEGVLQILRREEDAGPSVVVAAVGQMQFEVAAFRIRHEFELSVSLSPLEYRVACVTDDSGARALRDLRSAPVFENSGGQLLALFESEFQVARVRRERPDIRLDHSLL